MSNNAHCKKILWNLEKFYCKAMQTIQPHLLQVPADNVRKVQNCVRCKQHYIFIRGPLFIFKYDTVIYRKP